MRDPPETGPPHGERREIDESRAAKAETSAGPPPPEEPESPEELRHRLALIARGICRGRFEAHADDIVQKVLLKLLRIQEETERVEPFPASYLRRAIHRALVDESRRQRSRPEVALEAVEETSILEQTSPNPEQSARGKQMGRAIRRCLATLNPARRRPVILKLLGYSVPEIARRLGLKRKQAENLVFRGLQDLRRCLEAAGVTP